MFDNGLGDCLTHLEGQWKVDQVVCRIQNWLQLWIEKTWELYM